MSQKQHGEATEPMERPQAAAEQPATEDGTTPQTAALPVTSRRRGRRAAGTDETVGAHGGEPGTQDPLVDAVKSPSKGASSAGSVLRSAEAAAQRSGPAPVTAGAESSVDDRRGRARDAALSAKPLAPRIVQVLLAVIYPFILVIGALKTIASPWFLWLEYHRPGFPADEFGWGTEQRMTFGSYGVDYLSNAAGPEYLGNLLGLDGQPLFSGAEVAHMADVKAVLATSFAAGFALVVVGIFLVWYLAVRSPGGIRRGLFAGAVATLAVAVVLGALAALNWSAFFTTVHAVFFAEGTWTFNYSDALIRLYPAQFWIDAGLGVGILVLLSVAVTLLATWPTRSRREASRARLAGRRAAA
ncbi:TIGR01906 family membrane protein [Zhihengliuella flava]|uniref:Integral membrane protein (TIGR01906 family) n=1 Tax=Zhihengliuella flava TaxID=1285193 RepID=A0A931D3Y5_9MICC|nr:TIGR01906 family membrane protein [Zhihengliuella flava]MBG6083969.1 integral membrane protein (TIGR01906 family) [Zhihengliuella flava]